MSLCLLINFQLSSQTTREILLTCIEAMGGEEKWRGIEQVTMRYVGHQYWLEQSESPDGPYLASYITSKEVRAVWQPMLYKVDSSRHFQVKEPSVLEHTLSGTKGAMQFRGRPFPMPPQIKGPLDQWMRYAPEKLIFQALELAKQHKETDLEGIPHYIVSFEVNNLKHKLYINRQTHLLSQAELDTYQPSDLFNYPWGKYMTTVKYNLQWLHPKGFRYPSQWDVYKLGKPYQSITIFDISFQKEIDQQLFKVLEDIPDTPPSTSVNLLPLNTAGEIAVSDHIFTIPGSWYVGHIVQSDGIIVIEAPISSGYSKQHLDFLRKKYPDKPLKVVFATSDAWPHLGGIRAFAAEGLGIYSHKLNRNIINDILKADHSPDPDKYQRTQSALDFNAVSEKVVIDDPITPVEIYPVNGEGGQRMIALYMPRQKVLYASDLIQFAGRNQKVFFAPQYLSEVKALVDRHRLQVETVFAMHTSPIPWKQVTDYLKEME